MSKLAIGDVVVMFVLEWGGGGGGVNLAYTSAVHTIACCAVFVFICVCVCVFLFRVVQYLQLMMTTTTKIHKN